jgi:hypothetical protein
VPPTVIDIANAPIPIQVLVQSPADTETDMQVICVFRSPPVNTMHGAGRMASNMVEIFHTEDGQISMTCALAVPKSSLNAFLAQSA